MKNTCFLLLILNFSISIALSQKDNSTNFHESYFQVISNLNQNYLLISTINYNNFENSIGKCTNIDLCGNVINEYSYEEGGNVCFLNIHFINNKYYIFGSMSENNQNYLLTIQLNNNLELIQTKKHLFPENKSIGFLNSILDSDSNFVFTGYTNENFNMFFYKINVNCDSLFSKFFNTPFQLAYQIHESNDKSKYSVFLEGYIPSWSFGGILEINKNFDTISFHTIETLSRHVSSSLTINDSTFIVSSVNFHNNYKLYLNSVKYDGSILHSDTFYKTDGMKEFPAFLQGISKNDYNYFIGSSSNFDYSNPNFSNNYSWFHLIKLDENFNVLWEKWYGGDAYYSLNSVLATSDGGCLMVGTKYPHGIGNQFIQGHFIKVDANGNVQWTQDIETHDISFNMYPNPTSSFFTIENKDFSIEKIELFDLSGKIISVIDDCENTNIQINLESYPKGIYFAKITTSKGITTQKVVKQ